MADIEDRFRTIGRKRSATLARQVAQGLEVGVLILPFSETCVRPSSPSPPAK